jgi:hypothetical protein
VSAGGCWWWGNGQGSCFAKLGNRTAIAAAAAAAGTWPRPSAAYHWRNKGNQFVYMLIYRT